MNETGFEIQYAHAALWDFIAQHDGVEPSDVTYLVRQGDALDFVVTSNNGRERFYTVTIQSFGTRWHIHEQGAEPSGDVMMRWDEEAEKYVFA